LFFILAVYIIVIKLTVSFLGIGRIMNYIKWFNEVSIDDVALVGGKNASIGTMIRELETQNIRVPMGFAIISQAYWYYIEYNKLTEPIRTCLHSMGSIEDIKNVQKTGKFIRNLITKGSMPDDLAQEIIASYQKLSCMYNGDNIDVAVRSSATAEDLPTASFAGQQETYLNIRGVELLIESCKRCFASLYTDRAIVYRVEKGFDHEKVALSIGIQKMVRSDRGSSGVAFSLDTESGFAGVVTINAAYGLGETIVQGMVAPDEFVVFKPTLQDGNTPIIKKLCGEKKIKMIYGAKNKETQVVDVLPEEQRKFSLQDEDILFIARSVIAIEKYYSGRAGSWVPMDVEWAKDGNDGLVYIVQARPETVHKFLKSKELILYKLDCPTKDCTVLATGRSIGQKIVSGPVRIVKNLEDIGLIQPGEILVTDMTDPDWVPAMKKTAGIITNRGGRTCHAAIVSRELGLPAIVGTGNATEQIAQGQVVTLDCSRGDVGYIYKGAVNFSHEVIELGAIPSVPVAVMVNLADPDSAFSVSMLPVAGVGLARIEFIITNSIKVHPMAILHPERVTDAVVLQQIKQLARSYSDAKQFFVQTLAQGIGTIAAAFYPRPVIVRLSDFKSNEYRNLIGGSFFEPIEENPMIGFRGACRYYHDLYKEGFALECQALKVVRETMGLKNIKIMVPFVRTIKEAQSVVTALETHGLKAGINDLQLIMMCEVPSNVILISEFSRYFNGFSIGSNDLTQLTLGIDRDSALVVSEFDERDPAVLQMMKMAIQGAHEQKRTIGICGQAPSDYPKIAEFLIELGIDSISLNPDSVLPFFRRY
jgi:pyruvate,water dikinase